MIAYNQALRKLPQQPDISLQGLPPVVNRIVATQGDTST
jgi:hypothetical protein